MANEPNPKSDFDGAWKNFLDHHLVEFLEKFFPLVHQQIDWTRPFEFLDQELRELLPEGGSSERRVDKLVKVFEQNGGERWLLIHLEIQSFKESGFAERIYHYNHTIHRNKNHEVTSLVVLADLNASWHPKAYSYKKLGCEILFRFPTCKLLHELPALEDDFSLSAIAAKAQISALKTSRSPQKRFDARWQLVRSLYDHGFSAEEIRSGYRLLSWMMMLPEELTLTFRHKIVSFEEENKMTYISDIERLAIKEGLEKGLEKGLEEGLEKGTFSSVLVVLKGRLGELDADHISQVKQLDLKQLERLLLEALQFDQIADLEGFLADL